MAARRQTHFPSGSSPSLSDSQPDSGLAVPTLLSMAEHFLSLSPQRVQEAVHCLLATLSLNPPPRTEARARLQLAMTLYHHSNNLLEAREHLDKAMLLAQSAANMEDVGFEAASIAARILVEQNCLHQAKSLLKGKVEQSSHFPYWHIRLLLQLTDVYVCERDAGAVVATLTRSVEYAHHVSAPHTRLLCLLYKGAYLLTHKHYQEAGEVLNSCSTLLDAYQGQRSTLLRTFYLVIQVTHLLMAGQVKTAKPHLKQLQQCVKTLSNEPDPSPPPSLSADSFEWMTREQTYVVVYLVSMIHSVLAGYTDKALTYADKAMQLIQQQREPGVVAVLKAHIVENIILCLLVQGKTSQAAEKLQEAVSISHSHPQLVYSHRAVLHTLLGLYAFATDCLDRAVAQFHTALQHTNNVELRVFVSLNLAVTYMKMGEEKNSELSALMQALESDNANCSSQSLKAAIFYVKGLYAFFQVKIHEAKRHLRETLVLSNSTDLNKLTACALILLGQIFLSLGNTKETMDMVSPAMQLSSKIPDKKLQIWAASLLADLYHLTGDRSRETSSREQCTKALQEVEADQTHALQSPHNSLVQWTVGEWPVPKPTTELTSDKLKYSVEKVNSDVHVVDTRHNKATASPDHAERREKKVVRTLNYEVGTERMQEEMQMEVEEQRRVSRPEKTTSSPRKEHGRPHLHSDSSSHHSPLSSARKRKEVPRLQLNTPTKGSPLRENALSGSPTLNGSPVPMKTPEIHLNRVHSPQCNSPQHNTPPSQIGSPMPLKTPAILLSRVHSPHSRTPPHQLGKQLHGGILKSMISQQQPPQVTETKVNPNVSPAAVLHAHGSPQGGAFTAQNFQAIQHRPELAASSQQPSAPTTVVHLVSSPVRQQQPRGSPQTGVSLSHQPNAMHPAGSPQTGVSLSHQPNAMHPAGSPHTPTMQQPRGSPLQQQSGGSPHSLSPAHMIQVPSPVNPSHQLQSHPLGHLGTPPRQEGRISPLQLARMGHSPFVPTSQQLQYHQQLQQSYLHHPGALAQSLMLQQQQHHSHQKSLSPSSSEHQQQLMMQQQHSLQKLPQSLSPTLSEHQQQLMMQQQHSPQKLPQSLSPTLSEQQRQLMMQQQHSLQKLPQSLSPTLSEQQRQLMMQQQHSPQKLPQSLSPSLSEQQRQLMVQQQLQRQHVLHQQQQQALHHQQQLMLQQAHAQQQYFLQQASMQNQQMLLSHSPHIHAGMQQYYAMNPGVPHTGSPSKPTQLSHPQQAHLSTLQRMAQEPSRSTLGAGGTNQGHPVMSVNPYVNPYGQPIQFFPNGPNIQGMMGSHFTGSPLKHFPPGAMPGR